jgi:pimeloyl-ACP methyl ester carboxylesterase
MRDGFHPRTWPGSVPAPPVVCLHALGGNSAHWAGVAPRLARLGSVHLVDLGGHGQTPDVVGVTLEQNRELLAAFLAQTGPAY